MYLDITLVNIFWIRRPHYIVSTSLMDALNSLGMPLIIDSFFRKVLSLQSLVP